MDDFINIYKDRKVKSAEVPESNPLLNFRFDMQKIMKVIVQPI